jgi:hypothetical protein
LIFFPKFIQKKKQIAGAKNEQATRKSPGHITWVRALGLFMCKEDPFKLYKIEFALELIKWLLNGKIDGFFSRNIYRKRSACKNDQATRKSPGHITWVRVFNFFMCKEDPPNMYKI